MSEPTTDVESLLRSALRPIEPPENLPGRVEETLSAVTEAAAEELSAWAEELSDSELTALHTTEQLVEGREELSRVLEGVRMLPDDRREALIMRFALGMDNREIARALGRSDGATKVLIHRAIKQLEEIVNVRQAGRR